MIRNLKALGLAMVAALALSAVAAATASAESEYWFRSDGSPTHIVGEQVNPNTDFFTVDGGTVRCEKSTLTGEQIGTTASTLKLTAAYDNCKFAGSVPATVNMNTCYYVFHTDGNTTNGEYHVRTTIECENPGDTITVTVSLFGTTKCTVHVTEQDLGTGIVLTNGVIPNSGGVEDITAHIEFTEIEYTQTAGTGLGACPTADETPSGGDTDDGVFVGEDTLTGFNEEGGKTSIWVE